MSYLKSTPRIVLHGINDRSARTVPLEPEQLPQHLPAVFLLSEMSEAVSIASGSYLTTRYGDKTVNPKTAFYNHQTVLAQHILAEGNQVMVFPIKLPDSKKATLRLSVEVIGMTKVDSTTGDKTHANRLVWHATETTEEEPFSEGGVVTNYRVGSTEAGVGNKRLGVLLADDDTEYFMTSALFPIIDLQVEARGEYGNRLGIILDAPTSNDAIPTDQAMSERLKSFVYRMYMARRPEQGVSYSIVNNIFAGTSTDFVLKPNAVDTRTNLEVSFGDLISKNYSDMLDPSRPPVLPPFNDVAIYQDNIEVVSSMIANGHTVTATNAGGTEKDFTIPGLFSDANEAIDNLYQVNILTGRDYDNKPYPNVFVGEGYQFGGVELGKDSVIYARGGSDGFPLNNAGLVDKMETLKLYDEQVRMWCNEFNDTKPVFDSAVYPFSTLWDSGFSIDTKTAMLKPMGQHKRIYTILATQSVADYSDDAKTTFKELVANTAEQEIAIATMLNSAAHLYPESELYGTSTCRAAIVGRAGNLRSGIYKGVLPLSISLASKIAAYCGAGDGFWRNAYAIDNENNRLDHLFKDINITYQPSGAYDKSWAAGMIWVQNFDRSSVFFPAYQTVFNDPTSVLDNLLVIVAASYIQRVGEEVWRELVGNGAYGKLKFLEESNRKITDRTNNRFDGRFTVTPDTYYTQADEQRGYSWSTVVRLFADPTNLVNQFSIESYRSEDA